LLRGSSISSNASTGLGRAAGGSVDIGSRQLLFPSGDSSSTLATQLSLGGMHQGPLASSGDGPSAALARISSVAGEAASALLGVDRDRLIEGWIVDDVTAESACGDDAAALAERRLCVRWLDELIVALWHDLQAFMEWKVWDQNLREVLGE
jgi:hypothetical protein